MTVLSSFTYLLYVPPWLVEHVLPCHRGAGGFLLEGLSTESPQRKGNGLLVWLGSRGGWKDWLQDKVPGNEMGTAETSLAFSLNIVIRAFLVCSCSTFIDCHCCSGVFPRQGVCRCWYHCSADRGLVIYSLWARLLFHKYQSLNKFCGRADPGSKTLLLHACVYLWFCYSLQSALPLWSSFPYTLFLIHFSPPVLPSASQTSVVSFPEKSTHSHLELEKYVSNSSIFTLLIAKSHYENHEDVGGSDGKPKHNDDVTGILYHRKEKETYRATSSADWQRKWHEYSSLVSDIPFRNTLKSKLYRTVP